MSFAFKKFTGRMNSSRLIRVLSLNSDSFAKKNRKKEETPCLFLQNKETAKTETIQKKKSFFEKKGEYVKKEKRKKSRERLIKSKGIYKKRDTFKKTIKGEKQ